MPRGPASPSDWWHGQRAEVLQGLYVKAGWAHLARVFVPLATVSHTESEARPRGITSLGIPGSARSGAVGPATAPPPVVRSPAQVSVRSRRGDKSGAVRGQSFPSSLTSTAHSSDPARLRCVYFFTDTQSVRGEKKKHYNQLLGNLAK